MPLKYDENLQLDIGDIPQEQLRAEFVSAPYMKAREPKNGGLSTDQLVNLGALLEVDERVDMRTLSISHS